MTKTEIDEKIEPGKLKIGIDGIGNNRNGGIVNNI